MYPPLTLFQVDEMVQALQKTKGMNDQLKGQKKSLELGLKAEKEIRLRFVIDLSSRQCPRY